MLILILNPPPLSRPCPPLQSLARYLRCDSSEALIAHNIYVCERL